MKLPFEIGAKYKYWNYYEVFVLKSVNEKETNFYFDKNHWCTDNIFCDLIKVKDKCAVRNNIQLKLWNI